MRPRVLLARVGRRWFRDRPKSALFVRDTFRKWCADEELLTHTLEGFKMWASPHDYISYSIYFFGTYDVSLTSFVKAHVREGDVCWDVGSERGWFALLMGHLVGPGGRVDAFEAFPPNFAKLKNNIALNAFSWVTPYQQAVGGAQGMMHFVPPSNKVTRGIDFVADCSGSGYLAATREPDAIEVPTVTLDAHAEATKLERLAFIKFDIEGGELSALRGAEHTISRFRPKMVLEYNQVALARAGASVDELDDGVHNFGYSRYTYFKRLEKLDLQRWKDKFGDEMVINVYCFPE